MFSPKTDKKTVKRSFVLAGGVFAFFFFTFHFTNFLLSPVLAAPDQELTYHGKLTDTLGFSVADGNYNFTLTIYDSLSGGNCLWTARGNCTTPTSKIIPVSSGVFSTTLGESGDNPLDIVFDTNYYLEVKIDANAPMSPRRKITPTGFALNAHRLNGLTADNYIDTSATAQTKSGALTINGNFTVNAEDLFVDTSSGNIGIGTTSLSEKLTIDGAINIGNTSHAHAGTMRWNGSDFEGYDGSQWLSLTGGLGTMQALWDADNDTGVQVEESADDDSIRFDTAGIERMTISATGDMTLGGNFLPSSDDTYTLGDDAHRWQDLYLGPNSLHIGTSTSDEGVISYDTTNNVLNISTDTTTNGDIAFNTDQFFIDSTSGNIGIGTTITNEKLTVDGLISLAEQTTTPSVDAGYGKLYAGDDGKLYYQNGDGEEESISQIKQLVEDFVVAEGESVTAGDVVGFFDGKIKKGTKTAIFGSEQNFAQGEYQNDLSKVSLSRLDDTHFVVTYQDNDDSNYGKAQIGTVSGSNISYGDEYAFYSGSTSETAVTALSSVSFVIVYNSSAIVGTISGGNVISYGSSYSFNTSTGDIAVASLDTTHFVVTYEDTDSSSYGTSIIGTVSGSTISYGSEYIFNNAASYVPAVTVLDPTHFLVGYQDAGNSTYGTAVVGTVSGGNIISHGSEYVFNSSGTDRISLASLDATHFVAVYEDGFPANGIVGTISGSTISYGAENSFGDADRPSVAALSSTSFVVTYWEYPSVKNKIGTVSGNTITGYGTENTLSSTAQIMENSKTIFLSSGYFVSAYADYDSYVGSDRGESSVGACSGTTISSYGSIAYFNTSNNGEFDDVSMANLDATHFVVAYQDAGNSNYGTAVIGTVSGQSVSYGSEYVFYSGTGRYISVAALNSASFVVTYDRYAIIGSVSGSTISYGTPNAFDATDAQNTSVSALDPTHFVIAYQGGASYYGIAKVGLVSGTTISSYGTAANFNAVNGDTQYIDTAMLDATHFVLTYNDISAGDVMSRVASISGTTITWGTVVTTSSALTGYSTGVATLDSTHFVVSYRESGGGMARVSSVSGTTITQGTANIFDAGGAYYSYVSALDATHFVIAYPNSVVIGTTDGVRTISNYNGTTAFYGSSTTIKDVQSFSNSKFLIGYYSGSPSKHTTIKIGEYANNFLGLAQKSCSAGESCPVAVDGISDAHTGLTTSAVYYATEGGDLTTTDTGYKIGMAISSTEIVLQSQGSTNQGDIYFGDMIFANDFRITEQWGGPLGLIFKNHLDQEIMTLDELGNMKIAGQLSAQTMNIGDHFFVDTIGNVGIGTTTPSQLLTVFNGTTTGTYTTEGWSHSSDARLKTNVKPIDDPLKKVMALNDVYFNWINDPQGNRQLGFIAQEVMNVLPEVVTGNEKDGYGIAYGNLTAVLVGAMQEQQGMITNDGFRIDQNALSVETLHNDTVNNFADVDTALDNIKNDQDLLHSDIDELYEADANMQANILEEVDLRIVERVQSLDESLSAVIQFAKAIDNDLLINADHLVFTDDEGDVTIKGVVVTDRIETEEIVTQKIIVRDITENESIAGTATITAGTYDVFVPTHVVTSHSRIFVTPRGLVEKTLGVTSVDDHSGFHVSIVGSASDDITFDWFIVEKDREENEDVEEVITNSSQDETNIYGDNIDQDQANNDSSGVGQDISQEIEES